MIIYSLYLICMLPGDAVEQCSWLVPGRGGQVAEAATDDRGRAVYVAWGAGEVGGAGGGKMLGLGSFKFFCIGEVLHIWQFANKKSGL